MERNGTCGTKYGMCFSVILKISEFYRNELIQSTIFNINRNHLKFLRNSNRHKTVNLNLVRQSIEFS